MQHTPFQSEEVRFMPESNNNMQTIAFGCACCCQGEAEGWAEWEVGQSRVMSAFLNHVS
jgi:hypothetical protein